MSSRKPAKKRARGASAKARPSRPSSPATRLPVVGIGASAGGLEAFRELLLHLSTGTGMAFVLVQHLSPEHESSLTSLLARSSSIPVVQARDGQRLEPDHVYVIPAAVLPTLKGSTLRLSPLSSGAGVRRVIDRFLGSLAQELGPGAVGVVLSGTGTDGTRGLAAIQAAGGTTLAQAPDSARFAGMPQSAIAAGAVHRALPPKELARALSLMGHRQGAAQPATPTEPDFSGDSEAMGRIFHLLKTVSGVDFAQYKPTTIHRRISRRMLQCRMDRLPDYVTWLEEHPEELEALRQDLLIHVTSFFRDPETFQALEREVIPELLRERSPGVPLRIWVPGCATGEEAYSVAICFLEALSTEHSPPGIQLFGTDLSEAAIERARAGIYPETIADSISPERLRRYFVKTDSGYQVAKLVRNLCIFARQDLVGDPPFSRMDLVSCRNVLIYLGPALQRKVLSTLHYALNPRGFLVLGASESVGSAADLFSLRDNRHKFYRKKGVAYLPGRFLSLSEPPAQRLGEASPPRESVLVAPDPQREADRIVLAQYGPPGVIINDELEIMHFRGHTGPYLEPLPGAASLQLLKMAREELALELRAAVSQAKRRGGRVRREHLRMVDGKQERYVHLDVRPLRAASDHRQRYFLVLFEEAQAPGPVASRAPRGRGASKKSTLELRQLGEELAATREHLRALLDEQETSHEELRAANEEAHSSNEELQSTNEELETAKEELQATNEELTTVNEELESRNVELSQVNSDLNNLLGSSHIATVMLGSDLRIRRFTPMAEVVLKLSAADVGRSLKDLSSPLFLPDLGEAVAQVTETLTSLEREVQDGEGRWFQFRLRPYKTLDNRIDGAVMTVVDIDRLKRSLEEAQQARELGVAILDTLREPFLLLDASLRVLSANPAFYQSFQVTPEQTLGHQVYDLGNGQWNIPRLRALLEEILPRDMQLRDFAVEHAFENIGPRRMLLNARKLLGERFAKGRILLSIEDVSGRT